MINFLPVIFILFILVVILVLGRTRLPLGTVWLILATLTLANWGMLLFLKTHLPGALILDAWFPGGLGTDPLVFHIDDTSWYLLFALATVTAGVVFTRAGHLDDPQVSANWYELLILTAVGFFAFLADSPLAFLLTWVLLDVVEIFVFLLINQDPNVNLQTYAIFISRSLGLGLVIWGTALAAQSQTPLDLGQASGTPLTLMIAGASLRLGVLPLHLPFTQVLNRRRGLGTILRFLAPLSAISFLSKLASPAGITGWNLIIFLFALTGCIFGAINWYLARNELEGRPYWMLAFSSLAFLSYFHSQSASIVIWGMLMGIIGGWIFLEEYPITKVNFLLVAALIGISGFPFTPASSGIAGIISGPFSGFNPLLWIAIAFLLAGMIKFSSKKEPPARVHESWMRFFYTLGMILLLVSPWVILLFKYPGWNSLNYFWVPIVILVIAAGISVITLWKKIREKIQLTRLFKIYETAKPIGRRVDQFFHFDWLYKIVTSLFNLLAKVLQGANFVLEGEGGILWALVVLALLISLLASSGAANG